MDNRQNHSNASSEFAAISPAIAKTPIVLTIAGSDSGGGAGIQADIKAISATGSYACSVITALTAQNTQGVSAVLSVNQHFIEQQLAAVFSDIAVDVVKIGMLADAATITTVAKALRKYKPRQIVLDPVMVATSGDVLLANEAISALITQLFPIATVITPNIPEAMALLGRKGEDTPNSDQQSLSICRELLELGCQSVLLKGGHQTGANSTDFWLSNENQHNFTAPRIATKNTHGTGCTLSSAIASYLAQGQDLQTAISNAKAYISHAISHADELHIGKGSGPVHHFWAHANK
ncbi:MAG: bifunctional hydroxymethylpyrimidine kinase/phosphomethylpyrimidine kinase [Oceanospirillaceae bacterium]